jgi:aminoglycoside phosphotransferase (APT) family kinase protein
VLSEVVGSPLRDALLAGDLFKCARAGAAVGRWHASWLGAAPPPLEAHTSERELEILYRWAERAGSPFAEHVRRVAPWLTAEWPTVTVVHRDLYEEQIILGRRVGLIDLDDAAIGPPELDVGNLIAHIELLGVRTGHDLSSAVSALLASCVAAGPALDAALVDRCRRLTLLRLACIHGERTLLDLEAAGVGA